MSANDREAVVTQVIQSLVEAWNRRDSTRVANLFGEDAHYVDGNSRLHLTPAFTTLDQQQEFANRQSN